VGDLQNAVGGGATGLGGGGETDRAEDRRRSSDGQKIGPISAGQTQRILAYDSAGPKDPGDEKPKIRFGEFFKGTGPAAKFFPRFFREFVIVGGGRTRKGKKGKVQRSRKKRGRREFFSWGRGLFVKKEGKPAR